MQMTFSFLLSPPSPPFPNPAAASTSSSSHIVSAHHGRRCRPPEPRCRSPGMVYSSSPGDRGSYDEESSAACRPLDLDGGAASSDHQTVSAEPRYQATSTKGDTGNGDFEGRQKKQYSTDVFSKSSSKSSHFKAFGVDLSPDNMAVAIVYFVQGVLGLSRLAVSFYLKDDLQLDPAEILRWFLLSRLQLYLVSQPCHGWSSPFMVLSVITSLSLDIEEGHTLFYQDSLEQFHGV